MSDSPDVIQFDVVIYSRSGRPQQAHPIIIQPQERLTVDLASLLTDTGGDLAEDFAEGSISIQYRARGMRPLLGQVTITNPQEHLVYESQMAGKDSGRSDIPPVLTGLWWGLEAGRDATMAVSNTAGQRAEADVFVEFHGAQYPSAPLSFRPHETKLLSIRELLADLNLSPAQVPDGGITIISRRTTPTLIAQGKILDPTTGFSTTLNFPLPQKQLANALHASGVPIGTPTKDSPYAGAGMFTPHVIIRNLLPSQQNATISVEYPGPTSTEEMVPASISLGPYSTQDVSFESLIGQLALPLPYCSIRIQYSGPPGSAIAEVASIEAKGDLVIDGRVANEGDAPAGSGVNPWHLDEETESILFLTNISGKEAAIAFAVQVGDVQYHLSDLSLSPHETRSIDLRKLRDAQQPDFQKHNIPAQASDGSVFWIRLDNVAVMGRVVVMQHHNGIASNYDCCLPCPCPPDFTSVTVSPTAVTGIPGDALQFSCTEHKTDCNNRDIPSDITTIATWSSTNAAVATVNSTGLASAVDGGSAFIEATFSGLIYLDAASGNCARTFRDTFSNHGICDVKKPTFLQVVSNVTGTDLCPATTGGTSCVRLFLYRVLDQNHFPIQRAGMSIAESYGNLAGSCVGPDTQIVDGGTWSTDSTGTMTQYDQIKICCNRGANCSISLDQRFTVNFFTVLIDNGIQPPGVKNAISMNCSSGSGTCPVVTPSP